MLRENRTSSKIKKAFFFFCYFMLFKYTNSFKSNENRTNSL